MNDILKNDAVEILAALRSGEVSCVDFMAATLDQINAVNPDLNAIVSLRDPDELMQEARRADAQDTRGALHGLPIAVKDLANVAGLPTSEGSPLFAGVIAQSNDVLVQRMIDAGAIIIGKTNTPEFGLGSHTYNPVFGATQNALVPGKSAGGSSGGAAVALASHMVALADGSDMMGSLRNPASWNGVYGLRPTWGRVPKEPDGDLFFSQLSTSGPMARSPRDIALLLEVMSGRNPQVPFGLECEDFVSRIDVDVKGRRVAWLGDWGGALPMEAGVIDACEKSLGDFEAMGVTVEALDAPFSRDALWDAWVTLRSWDVANDLGANYDDPEKRDFLKPEVVWEIETGRKVPADDVHRANLIQSDWFRCAAELFERFDALILPTAQCWPFPVEWQWPKEIAGQTMDTYHRWMEVVIPASLIGLPALAVPAVTEPMPMGLQIIGRRNDDLGVLQLGQAWHQH